MNCVPGLSTQFVFTPTKTTEQMRKDPDIIKQVEEANRILEGKGQQGNVEFDYSLLCNKICGNAHYNMKMKIVVVTQEEYDAWLKEQGETRMIKNM